MTNQKPIEPLPSREFITGMWHAALRKESSENTARQTFATWLVQWGFNQRAALNEAELQKARDEELEACCEWLVHNYNYPKAGNPLRAARRPKTKSQVEEALEALNEAVYMADDMPPEGITTDQAATIRAALERLRELEEGND